MVLTFFDHTCLHLSPESLSHMESITLQSIFPLQNNYPLAILWTKRNRTRALLTLGRTDWGRKLSKCWELASPSEVPTAEEKWRKVWWRNMALGFTDSLPSIGGADPLKCQATVRDLSCQGPEQLWLGMSGIT